MRTTAAEDRPERRYRDFGCTFVWRKRRHETALPWSITTTAPGVRPWSSGAERAGNRQQGSALPHATRVSRGKAVGLREPLPPPPPAAASRPPEAPAPAENEATGECGVCPAALPPGEEGRASLPPKAPPSPGDGPGAPAVGRHIRRRAWPYGSARCRSDGSLLRLFRLRMAPSLPVRGIIW